MEFKKLFKRNANGSINEWQIIIDSNSYVTVYGKVGGKLAESERIFCNGKNIGKKNETTPEEQAIKTAKSIYDKKIRTENFVDDIDEVDNISYNPPMLAKVYSGEYDKSIKFCQPKLDGIRCNISYSEKDNEIKAISRENRKFNTVEHIKSELEEMLRNNPSIHLDGELYNHELHDDFNKVVSLVNKDKLSDEDKEEVIKYVRYNVYDLWDDNNPNLSFLDRHLLLVQLVSGLDHVDVVETYAISSQDDINDYFIKFTSNGYEGLIARTDDKYEHKRSKNLLKVKAFDDDEFEIVDICEGKIKGKAEYAIIKLPSGDTCKATLSYTDEECSKILNDKNNIIGKLGTVKYFGYTPTGKLRFPIFKSIRNYE